uniref:Zinc finger protein n=1 Tax=Schizaphis graminum TaxID=13262 RepID=A0A2S2PGJ8_SCHGA
MIEQMQLRFNEKSLEIIKLSALFESFESLITITEEDVLKICLYFPSLEPADVWIDLNSFKYVANSLVDENVNNPLLYIYKANFGYKNLKKLAECLMCVPVSTATAERSFSTMNRIMNKIRNRMGQETLQSCMKISTEGPSELDEDTVNEVIDLYARQKQRRIRLI